MNTDSEGFQYKFEGVYGNLRLHVVGPIEAIETVGPYHSLLRLHHLLLLQILCVEHKTEVDLSYFVNEVVGPFKFLPFAGEMEVEILISEIGEL